MNASTAPRSLTRNFTILAVIACFAAVSGGELSTSERSLRTRIAARSGTHSKDLAGAQLSTLSAGPEVGEPVLVWLSGIDAVDSATWDFGGLGCAGFSQSFSCTPGFGTDCLTLAYRYSNGGAKTVQVTVIRDGQTFGPLTTTLQVGSSGSCPAHCETAEPPEVNFRVTPNPAEVGEEVRFVDTSSQAMQLARLFELAISTHRDSDQANRDAVVEPPVVLTRKSGSEIDGSGSTPTEWLWTVLREGTTVTTSSEATFFWVFEEPGEYEVILKAANCAGTGQTSTILHVTERRVKQLLVPGVTHAESEKGAGWQTDLRVFNPGTQAVECRLDYVADGQIDSELPANSATFGLPPLGTIRMDDVVAELCPGGSTCERGTGSIRLSFVMGDGSQPLVVSRTYSEGFGGSFGQSVPAVPINTTDPGILSLCGMAGGNAFRTLLGVANLGASAAHDVEVTLLAANGTEVGSTTTSVPPKGSVHFAGIGEEAEAKVASLRVNGHGDPITAYTSVVDLSSGDPVLYRSSVLGDHRLLVPGVAHLDGADGSRWRSDLRVHNPTREKLRPWVVYIAEEERTQYPALRINLPPAATVSIDDVLGLLGETGSKGYLVVEGDFGEPAPVVALRTYNLSSEGSYGTGLEAFGTADLIAADEIGYIPGVIRSSSTRSALGLVNASPGESTVVAVTLYGSNGSVVGETSYTVLAPSQFTQFELSDELESAEDELVGTVELRVLEGGPIAAYAALMDNTTQDPMLIPAQPVHDR